MTGIRLRRLTFTGLNIQAAELEFADGLNILYGASDTGKSFAASAILFMLGVSKQLEEIQELTAYNAAWLGISLPNGRDVTLYRATRGGNFLLYEGFVKASDSPAVASLSQKHDAKRTNTISHLLLDAIKLAGKQIVRDADGTKNTLSINLLSPYAVVSEEQGFQGGHE